ncbi:vegetative cell wall protein gp1-like isoform X2 [Gadus morhua]|uniref:vegetative cell wall protein gp1-like isoform X2 n=1 Tax=Gadus morhua TaxID=8049 RepID=UPI0011B3AB43|nr:vegetative cell wall protein gp1-like isoform X2 [Gadus morhua]
MQSAPRSEVLLPCNASGLDDITWTFNHNQTILRRQAGQEKVVETEWQQHVRNLSESGSLLLFVTSSAQSEGTYRCTLRYADEEDVTHIELKILDPIGEGSNRTHWITLGVILAVILSAIIVIIWRIIFKPKKTTIAAGNGTSALPSSPLLSTEIPAGQATSSTTFSLLAPSNETQPEGLETSSPPSPSSETQPEGLETSSPPSPSSETQPEGLETSIPPSPSSETQPEGLETSSPPAPSSETQPAAADGEGTSGLPSSPLLSTEFPAGQATSSTTSSPPAPSSERQPEGLPTSSPPAPSSETQPEGATAVLRS